jgi:ABC-type multidrug transport system fused ATPase/permease subunit
MHVFLNVLQYCRGRRRQFAVVAALVAVSSMASLFEPWVYSAAIDDIAGVFVATEPVQLAERWVDNIVQVVTHLGSSARRIFGAPVGHGKFDPENPGWLAPRSPHQALATLLLGAVLLWLVRVVGDWASLVGDTKSTRLACEVERGFVLKTFTHLLRLPLSFFTSRTGGAIARQVDQVDQVAPIITAAAQQIWPEVFTLVVIVIVMGVVNLELAAVTVLALPVYGMVSWRMSRRLDGGMEEFYAQWDDVASRIQETVAGIKTVRMCGMADFERQRLEGLTDAAYQTYAERTRLQNRYTFLQNLVVGTSKTLVLALGGYKALEHELTPGDVVLFLSYLDQLYGPIENLARLYTSLQQNGASVRRAQRLLAEPVEAGADRPRLAPGPGAVTFEHVSFGYDTTPVLRDVSFTIAPGERVALVGPSGAGKTTITDLLTALYHPEVGRIAIDGHSLAELAPDSVREVVRGVAVDSMLFHDTVANNVRYGCSTATDADVAAAAALAGLSPVVARLEDGFDTLIGERGTSLSSGERQRVLLARVFAARPEVLILDEATANLDFRTEDLVKVALGQAMQGRTTLLVAHRRSMLTDVDRVLVLRDGRIEQDGPPAALMARPGYFRDMMSSQGDAYAG